MSENVTKQGSREVASQENVPEKGRHTEGGDGKPSEAACHYISLELVSGTLCCRHPDKV